MTEAAGRSCCGRSDSSVLEFVFQLDSLVYAEVVDHVMQPIPVATRSKAWDCGRLLAGIMGSNTAGSLDVCVM